MRRAGTRAIVYQACAYDTPIRFVSQASGVLSCYLTLYADQKALRRIAARTQQRYSASAEQYLTSMAQRGCMGHGAFAFLLTVTMSLALHSLYSLLQLVSPSAAVPAHALPPNGSPHLPCLLCSPVYPLNAISFSLPSDISASESSSPQQISIALKIHVFASVFSETVDRRLP